MPLTRNPKENIEKSIEALQNIQSFYSNTSHNIENKETKNYIENQVAKAERTLGNTKNMHNTIE
jgi:hypothetical protein